MARVHGAQALTLSSFKPESLRGRAGFFRVGQTTGGQWWLIDPHGRPFFAKAVAGVNRHGRLGPATAQAGPYAIAIERAQEEDGAESFARAASARMCNWNLNTAGPWSDLALVGGGLNAMELAGFCAAGAPVIHAPGVHLPDVFDPGWSASCDAHAAGVVAPWAGRADFIGYFTDDGLGWGEVRPDRPSLLQICLSLEPGFSAYHAAWEFVLAPRGGDLAALARDWGLELPNREVIRQRTLAERPLSSAGYLRDQTRFVREFAHRYFTTTSAALRRHDRDHLILGCRFAHPPGEAVLAECAYPHVDVVSWRCAAPDFRSQVKGYADATRMPLLLTGFGLGNGHFHPAVFGVHAGPTRVERMLREGRRALTTACAHAAIVGYEWARWADQPEDLPPFGAGLVHVDDREAFEHTELLAQINNRAESLRTVRFAGTASKRRRK